MFKVEVKVLYKDDVVDPQGKAIKSALERKSIEGVQKVSQGKFFVLMVDAPSVAEAEEKANDIAKTLLVNEEMETFEVTASEVVA